ncbi:hypothetical protein MMC16_006911 [Acarospora aff. strigata]|nr:hypothetical protein [Acarospora aff. strigata]
MATIDTVPFSADPADLDQRTWMIEGLQKLAYHETDNGSFSDIADWCMRHWLVVLQHQPENVTTLRGLGQAWTLKAHPFLERIQREERSISSGSSQPHSGNGDYTPSDDEREAARAAAELDARLNTADYVEARGMLLPAAEYFQRAVRAAEEQRLLDGDILTTIETLSDAAKVHLRWPLLDRAITQRAKDLNGQQDPTMIDEREQAIHPVVAESVQHNARTISNIRSLTASLFGIAAGILGFESYTGFLFYLVGTLLVSTLIYFLLAEGRPSRYFQSQVSDLWTAEVFGGLSSFVLTWTLFYGLVRA